MASTMRQMVVKTLGTNFREVTEIRDTPIPIPGPNELLVKNRFVGVNASDVNFTAGRYFNADTQPPFPIGFEGIGEVVKGGAGTKTKAGQIVMCLKRGAFQEYFVVEEPLAIPVPSCDPRFLTVPLSGVTASIALEKEADLKEGKTVLVTAAAGGTGQFAVQLAKLAGCTVIGTCSGEKKVKFLKSLGCDRVINYKEESTDEVLSKEYPTGLDVVYESIGGDMFDTAVKHLTTFGRMIVIGQISGYQEDMVGAGGKKNLAMECLRKSSSIRGFFLPHYQSDVPRHVGKLLKLFQEGKLKLSVDNGSEAKSGPFKSLDKVVDAVEYMFSRGNVGKVVVEL